MCLIAFDWQPNTSNWLTLVGNRDEFYDRPTAPLARWQDHPGVVAGRDLQQGGTWMGVTDQLRFAAVTNIRRPNAPRNKRSRGELVGHFLTGQQTPAAAAQALLPHADHYGRFNLLLGTPESLWYVRNWPAPFAAEVTPGLHVLSNEHLDSPWPKSELAREQLQQWRPQLEQSEHPEPESLATLLNRDAVFADDLLPVTGMPQALERSLSPQFLNLRESRYGTRATTSLIGTTDANGRQECHVRELSWGDTAQCLGEQQLWISPDHQGR